MQKTVKISQVQYIDEIVDILLCATPSADHPEDPEDRGDTQRCSSRMDGGRAVVVQTVRKTVDALQSQYLDRVVDVLW